MIIVKYPAPNGNCEDLYFYELDEENDLVWTEYKEKAYKFDEYFTSIANPIEIVRILDQIADSDMFPIVIEKV